MIKDEYSPYKMVHHPEIIQKLKNKEFIYPMQVHLIPSNICNQKCKFCAYRIEGNEPNQHFDDKNIIETQKCLDLIDNLAECGVKAIQFTGGGEPLAHKNINKIFERTLNNNMDLAVVSNGVLIDDKTIELLKYSKWIRISVDSFSKETYCKLRNVNDNQYYKMIENIKKLVKNKYKDLILGIGFVVCEENYKEIYNSARLFKEIGVDNFRISATFQPKGFKYFYSFFKEAKELSKKTKELSDDNFTVFNLFDDRINNMFDGVQDYDYCPMKDLVIYIGADLKVYTCCTVAYNDLGYIGDLNNQSFKELWDSQERINFYKNHNPKKTCKLPCMFENKNEFINYCIKENIKHINYI